MRATTKAVIVLFLLAFGTLFWLASSSLDMVRPDIEAARALGAELRAAGLVEGEVPVRLRRMQGSRDREGPGLNMELVPSAAACRRQGGLADLAVRAALAAARIYGERGEVLRWWKVTLELPGGQARTAHLDRREGLAGAAAVEGPEPAFPLAWAVPGDPADPGPPPAPAAAPGPPAPAPAIPAGGASTPAGGR